jgi:hypothetical protein
MAEFNDNDKLDMAGEWDLTWRSNFDQSFTFPPEYSATHRVRFEDAGKGSHGGRKFKGQFTDSGLAPFVFEGETFYDNRGIQVMQMLATVKGLQYIQVYAGKHQLDSSNPRKIWILGAAFDVGGELGLPNGGVGAPIVFQLIKRSASVKPK